jgi:hypothetical protein
MPAAAHGAALPTLSSSSFSFCTESKMKNQASSRLMVLARRQSRKTKPVVAPALAAASSGMSS